MPSFILIVILVIFVGAPLANAIAERISKAPLLEDSDQFRSLKAQLEETELRLARSEDRLASVEDRLQFYEKLLDNPENRSRIRSASES